MIAGAHHEEERLVDLGQDVDWIGGYRLSTGTPGQGEEPRLADDVQVGADVLRLVLTGDREGKRVSKSKIELLNCN